MKKIDEIVAKVGGWPEVLRDLHVYGGGVLVASGLSLASPPAGPIALGVLFIFLGLRRVR